MSGNLALYVDDTPVDLPTEFFLKSFRKSKLRDGLVPLMKAKQTLKGRADFIYLTSLTGALNKSWWPTLPDIFERSNNVILELSELLPITEDEENTKVEASPWVLNMNKATREFIELRGLRDEINWLNSVLLNYFPDSDFDIEFLPDMDGEGDLLDLEVYSSLTSEKFRDRRHEMCEAMLSAGHESIYDMIGISQREKRDDKRQPVSWYSSTAE